VSSFHPAPHFWHPACIEPNGTIARGRIDANLGIGGGGSGMARAGQSSSTGGRGSRFLLLASIFLVVAGLYFAQEVLVPLALAILFSFLLGPLVKMLERRGLGRVSAVVAVVLVALGIVTALTWVTTVQVLTLLDELPKYKDEIVSKVHVFKDRFTHPGGTMDKLSSIVQDVEKATTQPASQPSTTQAAAAGEGTAPATPLEHAAENPKQAAARELAGVPPDGSPQIGTVRDNPIWVAPVEKPEPFVAKAKAALGTAIGPIGTAGLVVVFVIFMLLQREDLRDRIIRLVGKGQIHVTTTALDDAATRISRYLMAQAIVNGTYGIAIGIGLWAIGFFVGGRSFPSFVLWGLLCAILRFIPYIGPWIAAAFPMTLSLAVYHGFGVFVGVIALFVVIELLSNNFMEPLLYGASTGMSTVAILVSAVFWTWLWGAIGLVLATPLTVCLVVIGKYVPQLQFLDILLGDEPVLEPPARVYQRLLALDQKEAAELAQGYLNETGSLERVYDDVLLPALAMAEQDRHKGKIDEERETFIAQSMRDMIDELGDAARALEEQRAGEGVKEAAAATVARAKGEAPPATAATNGNGKPSGKRSVDPDKPSPVLAGERPMLPKGCTVNIVCLPARDEGDDIANQMLVQLLALRGYCAFGIPVAALASEMIEAVDKRQAHLVIVSALPPGAVSYSRYLCKRVHARYPEMLMAVGLWTLKGDLKKAKERITCAAAVQVDTTLGGMLEQIHQMVQPIIVRGEAAGAETSSETDAPTAGFTN
jgi:predicted PurR-regulated permease PerM